MRLSTLLGPRMNGRARPRAVAFEGPLGAARRPVDQGDLATGISALEIAFTAHSTGPDQSLRVGVLSNHRIETYLTVLACIAGRHTFVPLNPKFPAQRLQQNIDLAAVDLIVHDIESAGAAAVIAAARPTIDSSLVIETALTNASADPRTDGLDDTTLTLEAIGRREVDPDALAYVMFTSGSTGTPKGVPISYGSLTSYVRSICDLVTFPVDARHTQFFDLSFDLSIHDIFVSHHSDGVLVAPTPIDNMMPAAYVKRERIDVWFSVPLLGAQLARTTRPEGTEGLSLMMFCGEALPMETVTACRSWVRDGAAIWNLYGPTEATIAFTGHQVRAGVPVTGTASIGRPFGANKVALLREDGTTTAADEIGDEGELLLGGVQVFGGYSTPAPSPFVDHGGECYYRSGDLVRVEAVGLSYRGRVDSQVKYRGYRIELGEVEAAVRSTFGLHSVAVVMRGEGQHVELRAYYLASEADGILDLTALRELLPAYMIPGSATALDTMPTNVNGKIDRRNLP